MCFFSKRVRISHDERLEYEQKHEAYGEGDAEGEAPFPGGRLLNFELLGTQRVLEGRTEVEDLGDDHVDYARQEMRNGDVGDVSGNATGRHCLIINHFIFYRIYR